MGAAVTVSTAQLIPAHPFSRVSLTPSSFVALNWKANNKTDSGSVPISRSQVPHFYFLLASGNSAHSRDPGMSDLCIIATHAALEISVFPIGVLGSGQGLITLFPSLCQLKNLTGLNQRR